MHIAMVVIPTSFLPLFAPSATTMPNTPAMIVIPLDGYAEADGVKMQSTLGTRKGMFL